MSKHIFSFYISSDLLIKTPTITIKKDSDIFHRLTSVLRYKTNEHLIFFNDDTYYSLSIEEINKQYITCKILEQHNIMTQEKKITAYVPLIEKNYLNEALYIFGQQQIDEIFFVRTQHSHIKKLETYDFERFRKVMIAGCEQAKQYKIPSLKKEILTIQELQFKNFYFFSEFGKSNLKDITSWEQDNISFFCGPEAGLTKEEEDFLMMHASCSITLGKNILRSRDVLMFSAILFRSLT